MVHAVVMHEHRISVHLQHSSHGSSYPQDSHRASLNMWDLTVLDIRLRTHNVYQRSFPSCLSARRALNKSPSSRNLGITHTGPADGQIESAVDCTDGARLCIECERASRFRRVHGMRHEICPLCDEQPLTALAAGAQELHDVAVPARLQNCDLLIEVCPLFVIGVEWYHLHSRSRAGGFRLCYVALHQTMHRQQYPEAHTLTATGCTPCFMALNTCTSAADVVTPMLEFNMSTQSHI